MADGALDKAKNVASKVTDFVKDEDNISGALGVFAKNTVGTVKNLGGNFADGVKGINAPNASGVVGKVGGVFGGVVRKTNDTVVWALKDPIASKALMVVLAVAVYKGIKDVLGFGRKNEAVNTKAQELNQLQKQNNHLAAEYQFDNLQAKGGHRARLDEQEVPGQGYSRNQ
ncbi:MAG: hypothetical protein P8P30_03080 [Rickettsiales bacterium]|nr:hypothetical protein [Rickettsiales bacterium]